MTALVLLFAAPDLDSQEPAPRPEMTEPCRFGEHLVDLSGEQAEWVCEPEFTAEAEDCGMDLWPARTAPGEPAHCVYDATEADALCDEHSFAVWTPEAYQCQPGPEERVSWCGFEAMMFDHPDEGLVCASPEIIQESCANLEEKAHVGEFGVHFCAADGELPDPHGDQDEPAIDEGQAPGQDEVESPDNTTPVDDDPWAAEPDPDELEPAELEPATPLSVWGTPEPGPRSPWR